MAADDKQIDPGPQPTDPALPGPDAPTGPLRGKPDASWGIGINMRAFEESPTSKPPTLDELETILESFLSAQYPGHAFNVTRIERTDK